MGERGPSPPPSRLYTGDRRDLWRRSRASILRVALVGGVASMLYAFAPIGRRAHPRVVLELCLALLILLVVIVLEIRAVSRSPHPEVRVAEAIGVTMPLVLLPFSAAYFVTSMHSASSFTEHLSRLDALYFTITTFATVGYGDIAAKSEGARAMVTVQMVVDLVLIGLIAKVLLGAARQRRDYLAHEDEQLSPEDERQEH